MKISDKRVYALIGKTVIVLINDRPEIVKNFGISNTCSVRGVFYNLIEYSPEKWLRVKRLIKYITK